MNEFPNESLTISLGKIYCNACHLVLSSKKSIIKNHVTAVRHKNGKEDLEKVCVRQQTLSENWATYQKTNAPDCAGAGLLSIPNDVAKRRVDVPAHLATRPVCRRARRQMGRPICQHFVPSADGTVGRRDGPSANILSRLQTSATLRPIWRLFQHATLRRLAPGVLPNHS